jgi:hypothetical protein
MEHKTIILVLTPEQAIALAQFAKRIDNDALVRYSQQNQQLSTEEALTELREALSVAGFSPR